MKHSATLATDTLHIKKSGLHVFIGEDGKRLGTLVVSNAKIEWWPKGKWAKESAISLRWHAFATLLENYKKQH